jgi:phosphatidylinositol-3-phosphatase
MVSLTARAVAGMLVAALAVLGACSSNGSDAAASGTTGAGRSSAPASGRSSAASGSTSASGLPRPDHVVVVIFENHGAGSVIGAAKAPYLNLLAASGATLKDAHGIRHPSQPNYLALFSGSTQGVKDDACPLTFRGPNLAAQLHAAGYTFTGYSEDLPSVGYTGCRTGGYARKHNPWVDFPALPASMNQPYSALPRNYADLPTVSFVVPNLCNDMHDCPVSTGDSWARQNLTGYIAWAGAHNSLLIVTFDEDDGSRANLIPTFLVGPMVRPGTSNQKIDHYGMLRTLEDMYGLAPIGAAAGAQPLTGIWTTSR